MYMHGMPSSYYNAACGIYKCNQVFFTFLSTHVHIDVSLIVEIEMVCGNLVMTLM